MGASVSWIGSAASIAASFNFNRESVRSRFLVKYTQGYYTVDIDQPANPSALLSPTVDPEEVREKIPPTSPPLYVSSITYGRMVVFTFESDYSATEMGAALEFAYRGGVDVSGDVSVTYKDIVSSSKITAYILGGSGGDAAQSIDSYEALMEFIKSGGDYSRDSPGAPIAYTLSYLRDNAPARLSLTEEYSIRDCARVSQKVRVTLDSIRVDKAGGDNDDLELYGQAWAIGKQPATLFDRDQPQFVQIREGETWPGDGGPINEVVVDVVPDAGRVVTVGARLTDHDGSIFDADDFLGEEVIRLAFETGWRRSVTVLLTGDDARVELNFSLEPI
jgi:thiol-activated cytolysin